MTTRRYTAQRMQTNSAWVSVFQFVSGKPSIPFSIATWTLKGTVERVNLPDKNFDLIPRMTLLEDTSQLQIALSEDDTQALGVGRVVFEVLRVDPLPQRPILKFWIDNYAGVVV